MDNTGSSPESVLGETYFLCPRCNTYYAGYHNCWVTPTNVVYVFSKDDLKEVVKEAIKEFLAEQMAK